MSEKLNTLRGEIDNVDAQLISLLGARFALTRQVGLVKFSEQLPPTDVDREHAKLTQVAKAAEAADVPKQLASDIMRVIIDEVVKEHNALTMSSRDAGFAIGGWPDGEFNWLG